MGVRFAVFVIEKYLVAVELSVATFVYTTTNCVRALLTFVSVWLNGTKVCAQFVVWTRRLQLDR